MKWCCVVLSLEMTLHPSRGVCFDSLKPSTNNSDVPQGGQMLLLYALSLLNQIPA